MKVIVYGIGKRYFDLFDHKETMDMGIIVNEVEIVGFSDSDPRIFGKEILYNGMRFRVKDIKEFSTDEFEKIMVTTSDYFEEISEELVRKGYQSDQVFLADNIFEPYHESINYGKYALLDRQWPELFKQMEDGRIFFEARSYHNVAVYGTGLRVKRLIHVLKQAGIVIDGLISADADGELEGIPIYNADEIPETDLIIVTDNNNYMDIEKKLCERSKTEVISMQELIYKTLKNCNKGIKTCVI